MDVAKQIVIIYAGTRGLLDAIPVDRILEFEVKLNDALDSKYADFIKLLHKELALTDEVETALKTLIEDFTRTWN